MCVFGDVSEGFFGDAIQSGSGRSREAGGDSAVDVIDRNAFDAGKFRAAFAQGHGQTEVVQRGRIQNACEMVQVAAQAGYTPLKNVRLLRGGLAAWHVCRLQAHGRHPLAQAAVQFRGHPAAFLFLLAEQAGCQGLQLLAAAHQRFLLRLQGLLGYFLMRNVAGIQNNAALRIGEEFPGDTFQHPPGAVSIAETVFAGMLAMRVSHAGAQESADRLRVVRVHEFEDRPAHQFLGPDPQNALRCGALVANIPVGRQHRGSIHRILQ